MLNCPHGGVCANCKYVRSMAVGSLRQDRVFACKKYRAIPHLMLGYDGRYGNRPVPVTPVGDSCFETDKHDEVTGGWFS